MHGNQIMKCSSQKETLICLFSNWFIYFFFFCFLVQISFYNKKTWCLCVSVRMMMKKLFVDVNFLFFSLFSVDQTKPDFKFDFLL